MPLTQVKTSYKKKIKKKKLNFKESTLPGFEDITIHEISIFFFKGLKKGSLNTRASSISFQFLLAVIPGFGFLLTLIPYIPITNFQEGITELMRDFMPNAAYSTIIFAINDVSTKHLGIQAFGFLIAIVFATNGISSVIKTFNTTYNTIETRSWIEQKIISFFLALLLIVLIAFSISFIIFTRSVLEFFVAIGIIKKYFIFYLLNSGKWIIVFLLIFSAISCLYYFTPSRKSKWNFFNPGALTASILTLAASLGFSFFINHFGRFDQLYGSIGALIVILIWINFNSLALLIGFELNASISNAQNKKNNQ